MTAACAIGPYEARVRDAAREPHFENLLTVLRGEAPPRPTLFEFFMNAPLYEKMTDPTALGREDRAAAFRVWIHAFKNMGYDYATVASWNLGALCFPAGKAESKHTKSLNDGAVIQDRSTFEAYPWMDPAASDYSVLADLEAEMPRDMKMVLSGPGGVLENVISLMGYDNLCYLIADDPGLVEEIFAAVGSRLATYYDKACAYDVIGAAISNDDWGFKTQTMLAPDDMRRFCFPWHKAIVEAIHKHGKPAILHSCGKFDEVIDDIVDDIGYDGRHSYEDAILPVEDAYEQYGERIAILGGIDVDFICRASADEVYERSRAMLERSRTRGGYGLGTGNSVPEYIPQEKFFAMLAAALEG